ncbi:capsule biosynthesis protein [Aristophania vespae]|uniref:capsule biosynthesis protein n=1 Tax=Aristophania vespae TaxID=2697033 RepID=UPI001F371A04|nr:capsule biosynthesis protein [Aristophania vespae]
MDIVNANSNHPPSLMERLVQGVKNFWHNHKPFCITVILPTVITAFYLYVIAAPQYISEAHFVVHGHSTQPSSPLSLSNLVQSGSTTSENTYVVQDYMVSRDAVHKLSKKLDFNAIFNPKKADFLARYPAFFDFKDKEHFFRYYKRHVKVVMDSETGISKLKVRSFNAVDSQNIAHALLKISEDLVNEINKRQRENTTRTARKEVEKLQNELYKVNSQLAEYRTQTAMLDPDKQSTPLLGSITSLQQLLLTYRMQLTQLEQAAPHNPMISVYRQHIKVLKKEIEQAQLDITGAQNESLVPKIRGYDDLILQRKLLTHLLASATASLETAQAQADKQMIFVDVPVQPNLPDWPEYPYALLCLAVVFVCFLFIHVMVRMLILGPGSIA